MFGNLQSSATYCHIAEVPGSSPGVPTQFKIPQVDHSLRDISCYAYSILQNFLKSDSLP